MRNDDDLVLLSPEAVAQVLGITVEHLSMLRLRGSGPSFVRVGQRTVRYRPDAVRTWIETRSHYPATVERLDAIR